ncbi:HIT family protein [Desertimonas flava]|uniref:HIT family protein n=1 Tax=Desertimonas flava TaxID=2064846 RepID=UPI001D0C13D5|nr:HIT domain-containing protein [Desertimonas flava]
MTLDRLWNGWRAAYVAGHGVDRTLADALDAGDADLAAASVFTRILHSGMSDEEANIVHRGEHCFVIMNAFPYTSGHLLVLPYREVPDLEDLDGAESAELWATVTDAVRVLKATYRPEGLNVGINLGQPAGGSVSQHLHVHVVPRWSGDANFMSAVADTRTLPEAIGHSAARVRDAWIAFKKP